MRIGALFAQPFSPVKAKEMLDILGVAHSRRNFHFAMWGADQSYGKKWEPKQTKHVFPRLNLSSVVKSESMVELRQRRRAEKLALKEEQRLENAQNQGQTVNLQMGV